MSRLVDSLAVWLVCAVFVVMDGASDFSVVGLLVALIALCACRLFRTATMRNVWVLLFLALCAFWQPTTAFLPVAVYLCMSQCSVLLRASCAIAWGVVAVRTDLAYAVILLMLCVVSVLLAWRATKESAAWYAMRISRDGIKEEMLSLAEQNLSIQRELEGRDAIEDVAVDPLEGLTARERQIATLVAEGCDNRAIAEQLFLSEGTVRNNISTILSKKQLKNRTQLAVLCLSQG